MWSFWNGFLALILTGFELLRWGVLGLRGRAARYEVVTEVWLERSGWEVVLYMFGQLAFLVLPVAATAFAPKHNWPWKAAVSIWCIFAFLTVVTLFLPIGARRRYTTWRWLRPGVSTGYERLFLGQMKIDLLLSAKGHGAAACLMEVLLYVLLSVFGAASVLYAIWLNKGTEAFTVPCESCISLWDFVYFAIVTIATVGYGDIYPTAAVSQIVTVVEIVLGWMYLAALLPTLISLTLSLREGSQERSLSTTSFSLRASTRRARAWLLDMQEPWGGWEVRLSGDLATSAILLCALKRLGNELRDPSSEISHLQDWIDQQCALKSLDSVGREIAAICALDRLYSEDEAVALIARARQYHGDEDHAAFFATLCAAAVGALSPLQIDVPADSEEWQSKYGEHWHSYVLLARILIASARHDEQAVNHDCALLLKRRTRDGGWYGDVLLTSLACLSLLLVGLYRRMVIDAAVFLLGAVRVEGCGASVVSGLEMWDSGWAIIALLHTGYRGENLHHAARWLVANRVSIGQHRAWSWSKSGGMFCGDTTSLAVEALRAARLHDVRLEAALIQGSALLEVTRQGGSKFFTFYEAGSSMHACPIISARSIASLDIESLDQATAARQVLEEVAQNQWLSEWFSDAAITEGLVLHYLAEFCDPANPDAIGIAQKLAAATAAKNIASIEGGAAALLGLLAARRHLGVSEDLQSPIRELSNRLLAAQLRDGSWEPSGVGVFGFGRHYGDRVFTTSICTIALAIAS